MCLPQGYAGDLSLRYGPPRRVEFEQNLFVTKKDSPTFARFAHSLKPVSGPGTQQRHEAYLQRKVTEERDEARRLVEMLDTWGEGR
jgi:hypothetical protein